MRITGVLMLAALMMPAALMCLSADAALAVDGFDDEPPQLLSFSYHPIEVVNQDDDSENILIIAHIVDNLSGLSNGSSTERLSHAHFFSADWKHSLAVNLCPTHEGNLTSGDMQDGVYVAKIDTSDLQAGNWTLDHIYLIDNDGNSVNIDEGKLRMRDIPGSFIIDWDFPSIHAALIAIPSMLFMLLFLMLTLRSTGFKSSCKGPCGYIRAIPSHMKRIYSGKDGSASTSKAQFFLWTTVAVFAYLVVISDRVMMHSVFSPPSEVPYHLLLAMGLSVITATAAKAISMRDPSRESNPGSDDVTGGGLFTDDRGEPDLSKIQMMAWTGVAVSVFFLGVLHNIWWDPKPPEIPDIDEALLALMGIGQGAYITKKIVSIRGPKEDSGQTHDSEEI